MSETATLAFAMVAGAGLGALFFNGLRWTVQKGVSSDRSALWFLGSFLVRTAVTIAGFVVVSRGRLSSLLACFAGFVVVRVFAASEALDAS